MRIAFCYPPFTKGGRFADLPQNRQFIYTSSKFVKPYPYVMAVAATWARKIGNEVKWLDGISRRMSWQKYENILYSFRPDMVLFEAKSPIMKKLWKHIDDLKNKNQKLKIILVGDHATYYPEESFIKSKVDYILTGGDYDFLLKSLIGNIGSGKKLEEGIYFRSDSGNSKIKNSGRFKPNHNLNEAPAPDRILTRWQDYGEAYLYHPCAYIMSGRGCGIDTKRCGVCTFCIWQNALWDRTARLRSPENVFDEVRKLADLGIKEIFDDNESGVLWNLDWLKKFFKLMKDGKLLGKVFFSSNARADQLTPELCLLLKKLNYRLLKVGFESGSDRTLATIVKREKIGQIIKGVKCAKDAGLRVMLTIMVGYPWESLSEVNRTYEIALDLMLYKTRAGDCLQASVITPYPGTPLWLLAKEKKWFKVKPSFYEEYDMEKPILKARYNASDWCKKIWSIQKNPLFILKSGLSIGGLDDIKLLFLGAVSLIGHTEDYHE